MTDAREIINAACISASQWCDQTYASAVINALEAAGFRILGKDELDPVTLEMAAEVAANWGSEIPAEIRALYATPSASLKTEGFVAGLTDEQKNAALTYKGKDC